MTFSTKGKFSSYKEKDLYCRREKLTELKGMICCEGTICMKREVFTCLVIVKAAITKYTSRLSGLTVDLVTKRKCLFIHVQ